MLVAKYSPFRRIEELEKKVFNDCFENGNGHSSELSDFIPVVNTREGDHAFHIEADLPGVKKEDIDIDIHNNILTITGERNKKEEVNEKDYYKIETSFGKFQRSFTLPKNVDTENINASTNDGVLEIVIPKLEKKENVKKIKID